MRRTLLDDLVTSLRNRLLARSRPARDSRRVFLRVEKLEGRIAPAILLGQQPGAPNTTLFHGDPARSGFNQNETVLTPANVSAGFGQVWQSPQLDGRLYATPLYADSILIQGTGNAANFSGDGVQSPTFQNKSLGLVFAATGGGSVYAIAAMDTNGPTGITPGTIVWKTHLGNPYGGIDGNSIGVLSTPVIDLKAGRLYVTASVTDYLTPAGNPNHGGNNWEVFALNLKDGSLVSGWPLVFTQTLLDAINQNTLATGTGPHAAVAFSSSGADSRGGLVLSPHGDTLYVDFAAYGTSNPGWMTATATGVTDGAVNGQTAAIISAYSAVDNTGVVANGGMWGAGGPAVDAAGNVFVTTGDSPGGTGNPVGTWGNSVLEFGPGQILQLTGAYTPWNYPTQDTIDSDLGGGSPILITLPDGSSTTTELLAFGGKQGNGYLADAGNHLNNPTAQPGSPAAYPADLTRRPPGNVTPSQDPSLYDTNPATGTRPYFSPPQAGPLALYLPYNESSASGNTAKARDTPATFYTADGTRYVTWAGSSKAGVGSSTPVAPSLYTTRVVASPGQPAYLQITASNNAVMSLPGANMITGDGTANEIEWIVDAGVQRTDSLGNFSNGAATLYAYDPITMQPLWSSSYEQLDMGGKYNTITAAHGVLFVGTDRIQAFGLTGNTIVDDAVQGGAANQFNYVGSGWQHITGSTTMGTYRETVSTDAVAGDFVTMTFTGSAVKVYSNLKTGYGSAVVTVDGGSQQTVTLTPTNSSPNGLGSGDALVYTLTGLGPGTHTLKVLNSAGGTISIDRVEIVPPAGTPPTLRVSMTDGGIVPDVGGVIPYTINYSDDGSILSGYGTAAAGVTITETVPANTTADLSDSTPGWVLVSGSGGGGSVYRFTVGALGAGVAGSVVFSVTLNSSVPPGTTSVTNNVTIADSGGDTASAARSTPIPPAAATRLSFTQQPPANGSAGVPLTPAVVVAVVDQFGNIFTGANGSTVTLTLSSGTFAGGSTTATATVANGLATFNNLIIAAPGTYTLTATDGSLTPSTSNLITVANSTKLGFLQQPTQTVAGAVMSPAVRVAVQDQNGNTITSDTSTITLTLQTGSFANGSTTVSAQAVSGVATFSALSINVAGTYTLRATDGILTPATSTSFDVVAVASQLVFARQPNNTNAGEAINPAVTVALVDGFGNAATGDTSTVTVTINGGTFFGGGTTASVAAVNGVATFSNLVVAAPGTYTLTASRSSLPSVASLSFVVGNRTLLVIDDNNANNVGSTPQVVYTPAGNWTQTPTGLPNNAGGTVTGDGTSGDTAAVTFTGTLVTLYAVVGPTSASAKVFIDGGQPLDINLTAATTAIAPVFTSGLLTAGSHTITVKPTTGTISIDRFVVGPATPTVSWATPADLVYGTALGGTQLDAFADVAGSFQYVPGMGTVLNAGPHQPLTVTFNPSDPTNYNTATATVYVNVAKATPVVTWPEPDPIVHGQPLTSTQLDATANVPGTFAYNPPAGTLLPTQDGNVLSVTFTPADPNNYNTVTATTTLDVNPATPNITWPTPADITDGTPLTATQLNATADVPGTFSYSPAAGTILAPGQHQALTVLFTPNDLVNYVATSKTVFINVNFGAASRLVFLQQPTGTAAGAPIGPPVKVVVQDAAGYTIPTNTSTVTLTLNGGGTFVGGGNTAGVAAVAGVATFTNLAVATNGTFTLTATDGGLTPATSNTFTIGSTAFIDFNTEATDFTANFAVNQQGAPGGTAMNWNGTTGVHDGSGGAADGGVLVTGSNIDQTAVFTATPFTLADGNQHVVSIFVTAAAGLGSGDRHQVGFVTTPTSGLNANYSFLSARLFGDESIEFQYNNGGTAQSSLRTAAPPAGTVTNGDWLQLIFTTKMTASGSFTGTFSLYDWGQNGVGLPKTVFAPIPYTVTGLNTIGTGATVYGAFRTAYATATSTLAFDNFAVDQVPAKLAYLQQSTTGTAGVPMGTAFVAAVEDLGGHVVAGDGSTITLTLSHDTFSSGATTVSATAVNGMASFSNLTINVAGSYILRATNDNPNLDPGFAAFTISPAGAVKLGFLQQPTPSAAGVAISPAVTVAVQDSFGNTVTGNTSAVTLTLNGGTFAGGSNTVTVNAVNGVATFGNLVINTTGTYSLSATDGTLTGATSNSFIVSPLVVPAVTGVTVNGGAAQRSRVTTVTVVFNSTVDNALVTSAGAFTLQQTDTGFPAFTLTNAAGGGIVAAAATVGSHTEVTLTFTGTTGVESGSLADGRWKLTTDKNFVRGSVGGAFMAANDVNPTAVWRLFGDGNGDRTVDSTDFNQFGAAFGLSNPAPGYAAAAAAGFDWNADGTIDSTDFNKFGGNFGLTLVSGPAPIILPPPPPPVVSGGGLPVLATPPVTEVEAVGEEGLAPAPPGPPTVEAVVVNGGAVQRSEVTTLTVTFDAEVAIAPGAFAITGTTPGGFPLPAVTVAVGTPTVVAGKTVVVLTFLGPGTESGSLADGWWVLTVDPAKVTANGIPMAAGYSSASAGVPIGRLFGDSDGDGDVDAADRAAFVAAYGSTAPGPGYDPTFDVNHDGLIDSIDLDAFNLRFGTQL
jgi:hypothetical protein